MKKLFLYTLCLALAGFFVACEPDFEATPAESQELNQTCQVTNISTNTVKDGVSNTTAVVVTSDTRTNFVSLQDSLQTGNTTFEYNERGHLTRLNAYSSSPNNIQGNATTLTAYILYYYPARGCNPDSSTVFSLTYVKRAATYLPTLKVKYEYTNDLLTKLTLLGTASGSFPIAYRYEYDTDGNQTKIFVKINTNPEYLYKEDIGFDGKNTYQRSNRAWMIYLNNYSKSNPLREKTYNADGTVSSDYTYSYLYNTNNFPTQISMYVPNLRLYNRTVITLSYTCIN